MTRRLRLASSLGAAFLTLVLLAAPVWAQQPEGRPDAAVPAAKAAPTAPRGHLWWNDDQLSAKLSLSTEQRKRMDALFEKFQKERTNPGSARAAFQAALSQGNLDEARSALGAWSDSESAEVRATGGLKVEVLSVLSAEQRAQLQASHPNLVGSPWVPRRAWVAPPRRQKPPAPR